MSVSNYILKSATAFAAFSVLSFSPAIAQSLPVPMPFEEQRELDDARMRQQSTDLYAGAAPVFQQGQPLGRGYVEAQQNLANQQEFVQQTSRLQTLAPGASGYTIKAGSFRSFENAQRLHAKLYNIGSARIVPRHANGQDFYGVYLGPWASETQAFEAYSLAMDAGMQDGKILDPE